MRTAAGTAMAFVLTLAAFPCPAAQSPEPRRLGHPAAFALVLEQFPLGMDDEHFPFPEVPQMAEDHLRKAGLPLTPRTAVKQQPPYLHISLVGIRLQSGSVYLLEADLRELVPTHCAGGKPLEVSTWQQRQWLSSEAGGLPASERAWATVRKVLEDFEKAYLSER